MSEEKEQIKVEETTFAHTAEETGDAIDERKLLRKLDWHLIPGLTLLFLLSFLDRTNGDLILVPFSSSAHRLLSVGNARIEGLATDLHMSMLLPMSVVGIPLTTALNKPETSTSLR
jgi:hypothetical protein